MTTDLHSRLSKAFRVRSEGVRRVYVNARRAGRVLRDAPRRAAIRALPETPFAIPDAAGFLVLPPGQFEETSGIVDDARATLARYDQASPPDGKHRKRFLVNVLEPSTLVPSSPVVRFALREDVLAAVCRYLRAVPFLTAINVFHSDTVDGDLTSSQLHHCDGDDVTQVKVFVYCSDVDDRSGPLTVLDATSSGRVRRVAPVGHDDSVPDAVFVHAAELGPGLAAISPADWSLAQPSSASRAWRVIPPGLARPWIL